MTAIPTGTKTVVVDAEGRVSRMLFETEDAARRRSLDHLDACDFCRKSRDGSSCFEGFSLWSAAQRAPLMTETTTPQAPLAEDRPSLVVKRWPSNKRSVGKARHLLLQCLRAWDLVDLADPAQLVLSELVTNSVRHARVPGRLIETRYERLPHGVRIEVHDAGDTKPERREPSADDDSGRGLTLVDALTGGRWGVSARTGVGKLVWAVCTDDSGPRRDRETVEIPERMTPDSPEVTRADPDTR